MQALISLDQDRLTMELEAQSDILEQKGCSDLAILACQQIAPLLMERKAIQGCGFGIETERISWPHTWEQVEASSL